MAKAKSPEVRRAALEALIAYADAASVDAAVRRGLVDVWPEQQQAAVACAVVRATGPQLSALLERVVETRRLDLAEAVASGFADAGPGGFVGLVALVADSRWPMSVRRDAYSCLKRNHPDDIPADLAAPAEDWEFADTARTVPVSDTSPGPKVAPWSGPTAPASPSGRRPVEDPQAVTWSGRGPSRPSRAEGPARVRPLSLARAQQALQLALEQGSGGFRALRTLAESPRVPAEVRVQALRHLASDFPDRDVLKVLEAGLQAGEAEVRTAALGALMVRDDVERGPVADLATDSEAPAGLRMRAGRFLASRWPKRAIKQDLELLLEDSHSGIRRVALEGLFPSMCYTPSDRVEARLINLLEGHDSPAVRASAARALGAFGGPAAIDALRRVSGWRTEAELRSAVRAALTRLSGTA